MRKELWIPASAGMTDTLGRHPGEEARLKAGVQASIQPCLHFPLMTDLG